jgi:protoheme IX farnesyltransferase
MTRFQRLAAATVLTTLLLVTIGVVVRATNSGMACPHWPGCFEGQFLPGLDADYHVWAEWIHRTVAALIGFLIMGMALFAVLDHRRQASILWPSVVAVVLVGFQAWLGRETVRLNNSGESVTAHLASAMALLGLLAYLLVRASSPKDLPRRGGSQRFTLVASFAAAATYVLLLFGSNVTATSAALVFPDWPLMNGGILPVNADTAATAAPLFWAHALHRYVAGAVLVALAALYVAARRWRVRPALMTATTWLVAIYLVQVVIGGAQVLTRLAAWTQTLHVALGAIIWCLAVGIAVAAYLDARLSAPSDSAAGPGAGDGTDERTPAPDRTGAPGPSATPAATAAPAEARALHGVVPFDPAVDLARLDAEAARGTGTAAAAHPAPALGQRLRAYVALTKPRIIELLLVTTVPAMVLATREVPGIAPLDFARLTFWTLLCGTLAAGAANAINQYLDRDIDERMARTRRRPLPAHAVSPESAMLFGLVLGAVSVALMAVAVNLLAAFLTLLAIAFYVIVYTVLLKRSTPQNIVIGGAAGALPPVIGWAAVTGDVSISALMLFLVVFYWTPPHFWALALRIRGDYAAAGVPMLPVVRGIAETSRNIAYYSILLVVITLVFALVGGMGAIYLVAAVGLGAAFLWQAWRLWRQGTSPEASTAQAIRLYRFSISYLTLLFAAVALDTIVPVTLR